MEGLQSENERRALERLNALDNDTNDFLTQHFQYKGLNPNSVSMTLNSQRCQTPYLDMRVQYHFATAYIRALEHRIVFLSEVDVLAERRVNREYRGLPPIGEARASSGIGASKTTGNVFRGNTGHIEHTCLAIIIIIIRFIIF